MDSAGLKKISDLLVERNAIDAEIGRVIGRPMTSGHLGEWIAREIFDIEPSDLANEAGVDGRFRSGSLQGGTVNVKWYPKRDGLLDLTDTADPRFYLVLAGPAAPAASSRGTVRPWCVEAVYLFDAERLLADLRAAGVKIGTATSVRAHHWAAAEVWPAARCAELAVDEEQIRQLRRFAAPVG
ncbi:hypothetical protein DFJ67_0312 [Asanoa ferruginea]|uniref:Uncharacterized protein n=1 Tax=Asanoa ferruginea TaxID=53367 RepID=A0A3D9ZEX0_9ACTN|nr:hypothetical protein [Asanoa ferruginea]REF94393.1 hypothetical protein DFJ67_0312 [Asanoa ferruginea]GIF51089.1 hypothetical protein Afe04nite_56280 [Asanoa ferruginea]